MLALSKALYNLGTSIYFNGIRLASPFNSKAKKWLQGRKQLPQQLLQYKPAPLTFWFHAASVGEFEQGRPLIETIKLRYPKARIVLTFFSPSGYEYVANKFSYEYIFYLPFDKKHAIEDFIETIQPTAVFMIKYEFWFHLVHQLHIRKTPLYLVSARFHKSDIFFRPHGSLFKKMLSFYSHLFVQNNTSKAMLRKADILNVSVTGDTRLDRVLKLAQSVKSYSAVEKFIENHRVFIAGSTWTKDEKLLTELYYSPAFQNSGFKMIITPHEPNSSNIVRVQKYFGRDAVLFSKLEKEPLNKASGVLIIDDTGHLSALYQYGSIAYVGGGFHKGIHNTMEPAAFGLPIIFGPKYKSFIEAEDLVERNGAFSVKSSSELIETFERLIENKEILSDTNRKYVEEMSGATEKIMKFLDEDLFRKIATPTNS